ncbi:MAG TPA: hypothetical protein VGF44_08570 [Terriglobales bacterium]|jgi:hypothetical protein
MLDVHPPHGSLHGWRDFLIHLLTITIGLFIALSLEGLLELHHHSHLVHEAEASLQTEIRANAKGLNDVTADIKSQQAMLKADVQILKEIIKDHKSHKDSSMEITFHIHGFDNISWKTAQSTGALAYMSYPEAKEYAEIYDTQEKLDVAEHETANDAILSVAPFMNLTDKDGLTYEEAASIKPHIEVLQGRLELVLSLVNALDGEYKKFLAAHPEN